MIAFGVVEYFTHTGGPVSILLEKMRHGNGAWPGFSDIKCIVEHAGALRIQAAKERRPGRAAYWILTKGPVEGDRFFR